MNALDEKVAEVLTTGLKTDLLKPMFDLFQYHQDITHQSAKKVNHDCDHDCNHLL